MGESWLTCASSVAAEALTSAPSVTRARPTRPAMGARTVQRSSRNCASVTAACASATLACAWPSAASAASYSCALTAWRCTSGRNRSVTERAFFCTACARCSIALA
ncbi:hypothetical protein D3C75_1213030 [compost metagenome]